MLKYDEKSARSELYARITSTPVNANQRAVAISALHEAETVTDGIMWILNGIRRLVARAGAHSGELTHNH